MTDLTALIEALERADRNSYELDRQIFEAVHFPTEYFGSPVESWCRTGNTYCINTNDGIRHLDAVSAPNYTSSIDAALTLVPEGYRAAVMKLPDGSGHSFVAKGIDAAEMDMPVATPALALCIAALKARAPK